MGKGALIGVVALSFLAILTLVNTQATSRDTNEKQVEFQMGFLAKELAMKGRKLVISSWIKNKGANADDINTINDDGGTISILSDTVKQLSGNEIAFTIRGIFEGSVHDVTSRLRWGALLTSPLQMKVPDLNLSIDPSATLNMSDIAIDTQSLDDLNQVLVTDLGLVPNLASLSLGNSFLINEVESELTSAGFSSNGIGVTLIDETARTDMQEDQDGMHFPDQVVQMINDYVNANPGNQLTISNPASLPSTFGTAGQDVLRIANDFTLASDLTGQGVLIVEGDFRVPNGVTFNWDGLVLVKPPSGHLNGFVDLSGTVEINGSLVIAQEGIPNEGHMDLTIHTDPFGTWLSSWGTNGSLSQPWWWHTHDFSGAHGTQVGFTSTQLGFTVHNSQTQFSNLLGSLSANDEVIFEFANPHNHGLATVTMDVDGLGMTSSHVAAGFDDLLKSPSYKYETNPIRVGDIRHLDVAVNRLSSLARMWDSSNPYPGCTGPRNTEGPDCVGYMKANRNGSFILRVHQWDGLAKTHIYDASLYWHRRQDEEDDFNDEMNDLLTDIQANNYGMDINIGANTTLTVDQAGLSILGGFINNPVGGIANLGTWHRHWEPDDPYNPLNVVVTQ